MTFSELGLTPALSAIVEQKGYSEPTVIQQSAIPLILAGHDLLGLSQTGTGKTAAFALPIIQRFSGQKHSAPKALIVAPTRELSQQLVESFKAYSEPDKFRCMVAYGGTPIFKQINNLKKSPDVVVGCPGRLLDLVKRKALNLSKIEVLVLDEADQMFDMGFLPDIRRLIAHVPPERQTSLFSATMPEELTELANSVLKSPRTIRIAKKIIVESVSHAIFPVREEAKTRMLKTILRDNHVRSAIVFGRTKRRVAKVADMLEESGFSVARISGDLSQAKRNIEMKKFKQGESDILVATDIAARGLDIEDLSHVINFDMPQTVEGYTHRIGRTGRASKTGQALTIATSADERVIRRVESTLGHQIERRYPEGRMDLEEDRNAGRPERRGRDKAGFRGWRSGAQRGAAHRPERRGADPEQNRYCRRQEISNISQRKERPDKDLNEDRQGRVPIGQLISAGEDRDSRAKIIDLILRAGRSESAGRFSNRPPRTDKPITDSLTAETAGEKGLMPAGRNSGYKNHSESRNRRAGDRGPRRPESSDKNNRTSFKGKHFTPAWKKNKKAGGFKQKYTVHKGRI